MLYILLLDFLCGI